MDIKKKIKLFSCVAIIIIAIIPIKAAMTYAQTIDQRIGGQDRYETAVRVSQQGWENSSYAVIAGGEDYADALCCGLLAQNYRAPVLLSRSNNISAETLEELKRLGTKYVFIIGGFRVINSTAETQLQAIGIRQIERLAGKDRFETAVKIAEKTTPVNGIILANGQNPWDVLTINTVAVQKKMPILLTDKNNLPPVVKDFLEKKTPQNIYLIGGEEAISNKLESDLGGTVRIGGKNRYETNALILRKFKDDINFDKIYAVAGDSDKDGFTDALSAGVLAAKTASPLILTNGKIPKEICEDLEKEVTIASRGIVIGGEAAVPTQVITELNQYINQVSKTIIKKRGTYGPDLGIQTIEGNAAVLTDGTILRNTVVKGDLLLADSIGQGRVELRNVTVEGRTIVYGGGPNSIIMCNFNGHEVSVKVPDGQKIRLVAQGDTKIESLNFDSNGIIEESEITGNGVTKINISSGKEVTLIGYFDQVDIDMDGTALFIPQGTTLNVLDLNGASNISGQGKISLANVNVQGIVIEQKPQNTVIKEGVTVIIAGVKQTSESQASQAENSNEAAESEGTVSPPLGKVIEVDAVSTDGAYKTGDVIITVTFSDNVDVTGSPVLYLETGDTDRTAEYTGGSGTTVLYFKYTVQTGDAAADLDYTAIDALYLNGGSVKTSGSVRDAVLTLPVPSEKGSLSYNRNIVIDTSVSPASPVSPVKVTGVSSTTSNGLYKAGETIIVTIAFDGEVSVSGTPFLVMETGETDRMANYSAGTGTNQLSFSYVVQPGDLANDLDYRSTDALVLNDGSIKGTGTLVNADLTLPVSGEAGSLAQQKNISIDAVAPTAIRISAQNVLPGNSGSVTFTAVDGPLTLFSWSEILNLVKEHTINGTWITGIYSTDLRIEPAANGVTAVLRNSNKNAANITADFVIPAAKIIDLAGNAAAQNITINAFSSNVTTLRIINISVVLSVSNTIGAEDLYVAARTVGQLKNALEATDYSPQSYVVKDSVNNAKADTDLLQTGDKLKVTAENDLTQRTFPIRVAQ